MFMDIGDIPVGHGWSWVMCHMSSYVMGHWSWSHPPVPDWYSQLVNIPMAVGDPISYHIVMSILGESFIPS